MDGSPNKRGSVRFTTIQRIRIKTTSSHSHKELSELYVTALGDNDIIFGTDWLHAHNPEVDWTTPQVAFTRCPETCTLSTNPLVITSTCAQDRETTINVVHSDPELSNTSDPTLEEVATETFIFHHYFEREYTFTIRSKTTTSTEIAAHTALKPSIEHIPEQYRKYPVSPRTVLHWAAPRNHCGTIRSPLLLRECGTKSVHWCQVVALATMGELGLNVTFVECWPDLGDNDGHT